MSDDMPQGRMKEFKYKFHYDENKKVIISNDPNVWVHPWKFTREKMHIYMLHWEGKEILFSALVPKVHDQEVGFDWADWTIRHVGQAWQEIKPYDFKNLDERKQAVEIIEDCLWQYNGSFNLGASKVRSVSRSEHLQKILDGGI